jgi:hypothetical protein
MSDPTEVFARGEVILHSFREFWYVLVGTVVLIVTGLNQIVASCQNGNATSNSIVNGSNPHDGNSEIPSNAGPATNSAEDIESQNPSSQNGNATSNSTVDESKPHDGNSEIPSNAGPATNSAEDTESQTSSQLPSPVVKTPWKYPWKYLKYADG